VTMWNPLLAASALSQKHSTKADLVQRLASRPCKAGMSVRVAQSALGGAAAGTVNWTGWRREMAALLAETTEG
jgi:hypothetical protein